MLRCKALTLRYGPQMFKWVFVRGTYLPLEVADPLERRARENTAYDVEVLLQTKEIRKTANLHPARSGREVSNSLYR